MSIFAQCKFHGVGQGLFYSGTINVKEGEDKSNTLFSFVYDCGSSKTTKKVFINNEIDIFKDSLPRKKPTIDLLVISHFDYDHISGLYRLLEETNIKVVIIPYVTPIQLFFCATDISGSFPQDNLGNPPSGPKNLGDIIDSKELDFFSQFYSDPTKTISSYGTVDTIIQLVKDKKTYFEEKDKKQNIDLSSTLKKYNLNTNKEHKPTVLYTKQSGSTKIFTVEGLMNIQLELRKKIYWIFQFKNTTNYEGLSKEKIEKYKNLLAAFGYNDGEYIGESLLKTIINKPQQGKSFLKLLYDNILNGSKNSNRFSKSEERNCISVMMHHQPYRIKNSLIIQKDIIMKSQQCNRKSKIAPGSTLLTGDVSFKPKKETPIFENISASILLIPHHGAKSNYDSHNWTQYNTATYVISHGINNGYGHPHEDVKEVLSQEPAQLVLVNENKSYTYHIVVEDENYEDNRNPELL